MPEIVRQRDRFREVLVQRQRARDRAADRGHFNRMRQARPQMIASPIQENLRLILEPAKGTRVNDAGAITLKFGAIGMTGFRIFSAARIARFLCKCRKHAPLIGLHLLA